LFKPIIDGYLYRLQFFAMRATLLMLLFACLSFSSFGQEKKKPLVYVFDMKEEVAPPLWRKFDKALDDAIAKKADLFLINMNTYGGMVVTADSISYRLINSPIPTAVLIDNNAASAGAWIAISCDSIFMVGSASIGAATVVDQSAQQMPDKYQSYMRSRMRSTAETQGRDPHIAEAMVDQDIYIEGIIDSGKVLTFTTTEAIKYGYCEAIKSNIQEVIDHYGFVEAETTELKLTGIDRIIGFLIKPIISSLLIMIIIGGIYFELQSPGIGFPLAAAVTAAILYFAPLYLEGLAAHWEILVFIVGVILLIIEIFALPGFGVAGVSGIVLIITSLALAMIDNVRLDPGTIQIESLIRALFTVFISMAVAVFGSFYLSRKLFGNRTFFGKLALEATQQSSEGFVAADMHIMTLIGARGVAFTILRPAGKVEVDGEILDASAETSYIDKGEEVVIVRYEAGQVVVRKVS
jgi:membrane-bound serine protease (ClpP class)